MKKDFDFMKTILEKLESLESPVFYTVDLGKELFGEEFLDKENMARLYTHIQLLGDASCITGLIEKNATVHVGVSSIQRVQKNFGFKVKSIKGLMENSPVMKADQRIPTIINYDHEPLRLTNYGYDLLESLNNNKVMEEVKKAGSKITIESLVGIATSLGSATILKAIGLQ